MLIILLYSGDTKAIQSFLDEAKSMAVCCTEVLASPVTINEMSTSSGFANTATAHQGWVHVTTGTGGRAGRVQVETLVALANVATANTLSGNTSNAITYYAGL